MMADDQEFKLKFFILMPRGKEELRDSVFKTKSDEFKALSSLLLTISEGNSRYRNITVITIP